MGGGVGAGVVVGVRLQGDRSRIRSPARSEDDQPGDEGNQAPDEDGGQAGEGGENKRLHEERIREAKRGNAEHLQSRRTAQRGQTIMAGEKRGQGEETPTTKQQSNSAEERDEDGRSSGNG